MGSYSLIDRAGVVLYRSMTTESQPNPMSLCKRALNGAVEAARSDGQMMRGIYARLRK